METARKSNKHALITNIELQSKYHILLCISLLVIKYHLEILLVFQFCVDSSIASGDDATFDGPMMKFDTATHYRLIEEVKSCK